MKAEKDHAETPSNDFLQHIGAITQAAINEAIREQTNSFEAFRSKVEAQVKETLQLRPVLQVKLNDSKSRAITKRPSKALPRLIANAKLGLYSLMVGPAGAGKTTAAQQLSEVLGLQFGAVCLTAGASETWLFGRQTPTGFVEGPFAKIYREGGVFLADEMDAADANLLLSINTALSHDIVLNPINGETLRKHPEFIFVGAANTFGKGSTHLYTGRSRLDAATLDRMVVIQVDYDADLEKELCTTAELRSALNDTRQSLRSEGYDEFISTRAFINSQKQLDAGVPKRDIFESLVANWGDAAKKVARSRFSDFLAQKKGKAPEQSNFWEINFEKYENEFRLKKIEGLKWPR